MAKNFPADFYVTCATVIPVLYLAGAVQGTIWESLMQAASAGVRARLKGRITYRITLTPTPTVSMLLAAAAMYIGLAGGVGEFLALLALYRGSEVPIQRVIVLVATLILVFAVVTLPGIDLPQQDEAEAPDDQDGGPGEAAESPGA